MAEVLETVAFGTAGRKRQNRVQTVQCLNRRLFIHTEHRCVSRRVQVQPYDIGGLGFKVRIVAGHVAFQPMRFQAGFLPGAMHRIFANAERRSQFAATPVRRAVLRPFPRGRQYLGPQHGRDHRGRLARMTSIQTVYAGTKETHLPAADGRCRGPQLPLDGAVRCTLSQHQYQPGTEHIPGWKRAGLGNAAQFDSLFFIQRNIVDRHGNLDVSHTSNVYSATGH